ncbi:hypothetical protein C9374_004184 [Naegleria lovaniensis]|uniref:INTS8 TPR repeats domain-containing protein n=1 Tax=Naegleria lovaniensis TaxID=51637 RepID=A0AA88GS79_NAELO|nr:uncharacterized protein C9374_004184 [Naegleria lovaniensis]KAG2383513.1 hypothetical protein C9374_004184 [Naegleria lovaniensis]
MYTPPESPGWYNTPSDDEVSLQPSSSGVLLENTSTTSSASHHHNDWFEYLVHPKKLDQHLDDLLQNPSLQPSAMELALSFMEQCTAPANARTQQLSDRTKRYLSVVTKIVFKSQFTLEQIEHNFPVAFQKHIIVGILLRKRKTFGVDGIIHKPKESDATAQSEHSTTSVENTTVSYIEIIYHRWIVRAISNRTPLWFIKNPSLEGTDSQDLIQLGESSVAELRKFVETIEKDPQILNNFIDKPPNVDGGELEQQIIFDIANYYFFREDFDNSFSYLKSLYPKFQSNLNDSSVVENREKTDSLKDNCVTLIIACQSILSSKYPPEALLFPEHKKTLFFRDVDDTVKKLNSMIDQDTELSDKLITLLIEDIIDSQLSREYRVNLCYKLIEKETLFKKILALNIIQDMIKIIQGHSLSTIHQELETAILEAMTPHHVKVYPAIAEENHNDTELGSVQTHLDRYVLKHKFVTSQPIIPVYIIIFLKELEKEAKKRTKDITDMQDEDSDNKDGILYWNNEFSSIITEFVCRLANYLNHPIVYATLLSEGLQYLEFKNKSMMDGNIIEMYNKRMLESVEGSYHLNYFDGSADSLRKQESNYNLLPENVQSILCNACIEKKREIDMYFEQLKTTVTKKRPYDNAIQTHHLLFSDDDSISGKESTDSLKRLKIDASDYLSLRARNFMYRSSYGCLFALQKITNLFDAANTIDKFKGAQGQKRILFDHVIISLSKKHPQLTMPEEYPAPRIESKQIDRPSPVIVNMEEFSMLSELCNWNHSFNSNTSSSSEQHAQLQHDGASSSKQVSNKVDVPPVNLPFLGDLFKCLVNLEDWAFIRDFFKTMQTKYEANSEPSEENTHIMFCRFALLVESLAYHMHSPRNGAPKKVFKDLKDDIYKFVHNLIYLPGDGYGSSSAENDPQLIEDENRLRWDDFHLLATTQNLKFLMDLSVMLAFVLASVRSNIANTRSNSPPSNLRGIPTQPISPPTPVFMGHYKHLAKLIMPEYFCGTTKKHWLVGNEKFVDETLLVMLQHILERVLSLQEQIHRKPISTFYLFKCSLADIYFEKGKYKRALELYLECGESNFPHFYRPNNEEVVDRMVRCLVELGEYTAAAVLHQFIHSTYDNEMDTQTQRTHVISDSSSFSTSSMRVGYTKEIIDNLFEANGLNERWLLFFYDLSYLEMVVHVAHQKGEFNKEDLMIQHIQRSEMNSNNKTEHRKEYIQQMKETFLRKLYLHITTSVLKSTQ